MYKITAVYFSPTEGTKKYVEALSEKLNADFETIDLTKIKNREKEYNFSENDLVIFGAPVYAGRLPHIDGGIFDGIHGNNTPAIFNVVYGNREFDDALLEEKEICESNGFIGIAAAAWIAPHTFSEKIAAGRPDNEDYKKIELFSKEIIKKIEKNDTGFNNKKNEVPGNSIYKELKSMSFSPIGTKKCTDCKICVSICPVGAIFESEPKKTDNRKCIACLACVKKCPENARMVDDPSFLATVERLEANLMDLRKEPVYFL